MFPPASLRPQRDARAHGTDHSRLIGRQTTQPTFASASTSSLWPSRIGDQPSGYHEEPDWEFRATDSSRLPNFQSEITTPIMAAMPLSSITAPGLSQHIPAADEPQNPESNIRPNPPRRRQNPPHPQYTAAEWSLHRTKIRELYIDQNKSLGETTQIMKTEFGFSPSKKMYKDKFSEWGFYKNLPREKAQWMLNKAEQRKDQLPEPKETVFVCRGREWTEEVLRNKVKGAKFEGDLDEATPQDTTYMTPRPLNVPSPGSARTPKEPSIPAERWTPTPFSGNTQPRFLRLTWNGQTLEALKALRNSAHELDREGDFQNAEGKLREVLAGFENLLSPTHEDTNAVAYELATLYAGHDRMNDADLVLNWMGENHVERWGPNHRKTQTHFLRVVDLFNSWSRSNDAMTFLYRVLDALDKHDSVGTRRNNTSNFDSPLVAQAHVGPPHIAAQQPGPEYVASAVAGTDDPARVDYQLGLARSRTAAFDEAAEPLLLSLIEQCDKYPERLNSQILQARCALLDLYQRLGDDERVASGLDQAKEVLEKILPSTKKTKHFLEACIKVAELHVKNDYCQSAEDMFQTIGCEVEDTFGIDHENTIELLICIGKIFQRQNQWDNARPWFERALAASMTRNGLQSTMTKRLEAALENQRYSVTALMHEELESIVRSSSLDTPWRG